jgi:hypothetical protein
MFGNGGVNGSILTVKNKEPLPPGKTNHYSATPLLRWKSGSSRTTNIEHEVSATLGETIFLCKRKSCSPLPEGQP